ncbi:MAG: Transposase family protein [Nevskia sp.]|nr:Transposase family protein [Nevskia sp.]
MKRKSPYSLVDVNSICVESIVAARAGQVCIVGVDVAKGELVACLYWPDRSFDRPWRIASPVQIGLFVEKLKELSLGCPLVVAMESSGTYGDVLRQALGDNGIEVRRVSSKAVKDHAETFDGVPSQHDGKDAAVIAELCQMGKGSPWPWKQQCEEDQALRFWIRKLDTAQRIKQVYCGKLESLLARHWPEVFGLLKQSGPTLTTALMRWGDPRALAADPQAAAILRSFGGRYLTDEKIRQVIAAAGWTLGVRMSPWQARELQAVAEAIVQKRAEIAACKKELKKLAKDHATLQAQKPAIGLVTACVLWMCLGDVRNYASAGAYRKAMGLNLKERSSGKHKGQLSLSKRGQRLARKWLYFSALRWLRESAVKRWVELKKARDGGKGGKAVVGVMRRLALAAYHVGKNGVEFDPGRLFPGVQRSEPRAETARR